MSPFIALLHHAFAPPAQTGSARARARMLAMARRAGAQVAQTGGQVRQLGEKRPRPRRGGDDPPVMLGPRGRNHTPVTQLMLEICESPAPNAAAGGRDCGECARAPFSGAWLSPLPLLQASPPLLC
jgi:hypothetical protein